MIGDDIYEGWGWRAVAAAALLLVLAVGFGLRVYLAVLAFASTFDTSTPALMALHILKGERPLFFYGQNYMGAPEVYLSALFMYLGKPSLLTVALGPIVATMGWIAATYGLFRDLFDWRVGIAAALCVAVPGWDTLWYSIGSYGGYPTAFFCGTLSLWLLVRLAGGELTPLAETLHLALLGIVAGLGMWSHYLTAVYLLTGGLLFVGFLFRERFRRGLLLKCLLAAVLFAVAFSPSLLAFGQYGGGHVIKVDLSLARIAQNWTIFERRCLPRLLFWPFDLPGWAKAAVVTGLCGGGFLFLAALLTTRERPVLVRMFVPVMFCLIFFAVYLPHEMARVGAVRYVIPMSTMVLACIFAVPLVARRRGLSVCTCVLLAGWVAYNGVAGVVMAQKRAPRKQAEVERRDRIVERARALGADTVMMVGGFIFGHEGQALSFYARDQIAFVSVFDERYQPAAQAAETAAPQVLAAETPIASKVAAALDALDVGYAVEEDPWVCLFHDLEFERAPRAAIPVDEVQVETGARVSGDAAAVTDRIFETSISGPCEADAAVTLDLGKVRTLVGMWLTAPGFYQFGLPEGYHLSASVDGTRYEVVSEVDRRVPVSYLDGPLVYMKGYLGRMECRFEPVRARYLRIAATRPQRKTQGQWSLSEVFVFERAERDPDEPTDVSALADWLMEMDVSFAFANRWLSAALFPHGPADAAHPWVFPRFNPKYAFTRLSREVIPRRNLAVVPRREVADDCVRVLQEVFGPSVISQRRVFGDHEVLLLDEGTRITREDVRVLWNGHALVKSREPEGMWF